MNRRDFIKGMAGILAAATAPAIVRSENIMAIKPTKLIVPPGLDVVCGSPDWGWVALIDVAGRVLTTIPVEARGKNGVLHFRPEPTTLIERSGTVTRAMLHHHLVPGGQVPINMKGGLKLT